MHIYRTLCNATLGQTHKNRRHMCTHTKHFAKQVMKGLVYQGDIEMNLDMFIQGKNEENKTKQ